jgi:hypothetical protein
LLLDSFAILHFIVMSVVTTFGMFVQRYTELEIIMYLLL